MDSRGTEKLLVGGFVGELGDIAEQGGALSLHSRLVPDEFCGGLIVTFLNTSLGNIRCKNQSKIRANPESNVLNSFD